MKSNVVCNVMWRQNHKSLVNRLFMPTGYRLMDGMLVNLKDVFCTTAPVSLRSVDSNERWEMLQQSGSSCSS